uniref:Afadin n=1 Tax=Ornithodoros erraticus TaxID=265619 RepID=A0A293MS08_ORNER
MRCCVCGGQQKRLVRNITIQGFTKDSQRTTCFISSHTTLLTKLLQLLFQLLLPPPSHNSFGVRDGAREARLRKFCVQLLCNPIPILVSLFESFLPNLRDSTFRVGSRLLSSIRRNRKRPSRSSLCQLSCTRRGFSSGPSFLSSPFSWISYRA